MDKSLEFLKSMSKEELNTLRRTIESILFPEPIPVSIDHEASDVRKGKSTQDILISAIKREDSAVKFFTDLSGQAGKLQSTFQRLAAEEKKHKLRLETFYDDHILSQG